MCIKKHLFNLNILPMKSFSKHRIRDGKMKILSKVFNFFPGVSNCMQSFIHNTILDRNLFRPHDVTIRQQIYILYFICWYCNFHLKPRGSYKTQLPYSLSCTREMALVVSWSSLVNELLEGNNVRKWAIFSNCVIRFNFLLY